VKGDRACTYIFGENARVDTLGFLDVVGVLELVPELLLKFEKLIIAEVGRSRLRIRWAAWDWIC
jgi:hypothetical protein